MYQSLTSYYAASCTTQMEIKEFQFILHFITIYASTQSFLNRNPIMISTFSNFHFKWRILCSLTQFFYFRCSHQSKFEVCVQETHIPVSAILDAQGSHLPLWANTLVLLNFLLVFRILGYVVLRYFRTPKWRTNSTKDCDKYFKYLIDIIESNRNLCTHAV